VLRVLCIILDTHSLVLDTSDTDLYSGLLCSSPVGILVTKHNGDKVRLSSQINSYA
jgi:hypothetical protein